MHNDTIVLGIPPSSVSNISVLCVGFEVFVDASLIPGNKSISFTGTSLFTSFSSSSGSSDLVILWFCVIGSS